MGKPKGNAMNEKDEQWLKTDPEAEMNRRDKTVEKTSTEVTRRYVCMVPGCTSVEKSPGPCIAHPSHGNLSPSY
ncbi:MAG: hypothetical protein JWO50_566 [Candidatus Kaiserbacteria bacterium]|nr:hypothetical protein [Candidatus Kaiserbacteria bacterium]